MFSLDMYTVCIHIERERERERERHRKILHSPHHVYLCASKANNINRDIMRQVRHMPRMELGSRIFNEEGQRARHLPQWDVHGVKDMTLDEFQKLVPILHHGDETPITGRSSSVKHDEQLWYTSSMAPT